MKTKWTKEKCQIEALKYNYKKDFRSKCNSAYAVAHKNKWIDDICKHMTKFIRESKWNKEKCQEYAFKYKSRLEFSKKCNWGYSIACKNNWIDDICTHMEKTGNKKFRCIYAYEFSDKYVYIGLTYNLKKRDISRQHDNFDGVTKHINKTGLIPNLKQLSEYIDINIASKLEKDTIISYKNNGWNILNITKGGEVGGGKYRWTKEECHIEALKFMTVTEFSKKKFSAYNAAKENNWLDEIISHMIRRGRSKEECHKIALNYDNISQFIAEYCGVYERARDNGWLIEICSHMKRKIKEIGYWTKERCHKEALKYESKKEFKMGSASAYTISIRNGWFDEICQHMIPTSKPKNYWTKERCQEEALKYNNRMEFKNNNSAYSAASRKGWLSEICSHMISS